MYECNVCILWKGEKKCSCDLILGLCLCDLNFCIFGRGYWYIDMMGYDRVNLDVMNEWMILGRWKNN